MSFCKTYISNICFDKKKIAILLVPNNLTVLEIVLLTEFMTHPLSLLFCRLSNLLRDLLIFEVRNLSLFAI